MNYFAIQQISTGKLLPAPRGRGGRGGTHVEFEDNGFPRMFASEVAARNALTWWLGGAVNVSFSGGNDFEWDDGCDEIWSVKNMDHRKKEDVRIVKLEISIVND